MDNFFYEIFDNSPIAQCVLDKTYRLTDINKACQKLFPSISSGLHITSIIKDSEFSKIVKSHLEKRETKAISDQFIYTQHPNNKYNTLEIGLTKFMNNKVLLTLVEKDISEMALNEIEEEIHRLKEKEKEKSHWVESLVAKNEELEHLSQQLQEKNYELDNFVYKASHDMRSPLTSVLGLIELSEVHNDPMIFKNYIGMIKERMLSLDRLVKTILNLASNDRKKLTPSHFNIKYFIDECISQQSQQLYFKEISFNIQVPSNFIICTDKDILSLAFNNVLNNAIKYQRSSEHYKKIEIVVTRNSNNDTEITISDNGIGIISQEIPKVFQMFRRGTDQYKGSGLGLYIVQQALAKLLGNVDIDSKFGKGTIVALTIPQLDKTMSHLAQKLAKDKDLQKNDYFDKIQ